MVASPVAASHDFLVFLDYADLWRILEDQKNSIFKSSQEMETD